MATDDMFFLPQRPSTMHNSILVKAEVGKTKRVTVPLPDEDFVYGTKNKKDSEGAKEVTLSWKSHVPPPGAVTSRDFVYTNRVAIKNGAIDAVSQAQFRKDNMFRVRSGSARLKSKKEAPPNISNRIFGTLNRPGTPIQNVINNQFQEDWIKTRKLQIQGERAARIAFKEHNMCSPTKASIGHSLKTRQAQNKVTKPVFKMKQFQDVPAKVVIPKA